MPKRKFLLSLLLLAIFSINISPTHAILDGILNIFLGKQTIYGCENQEINLMCTSNNNLAISITDIEVGTDSDKCFAQSGSKQSCTLKPNVNDFIKSECTDKKRCVIKVNSSMFDSDCTDEGKYIQIVYKCEAKKIDCSKNPCGYGATCNSGILSSSCQCPSGTSGDPLVRCCKPLKCSCFGDPHCTTFDNAKFHFMGNCKYDFVSTECDGKVLPPGLVPFSIKHKQEKRGSGANSNKVSYIRFVEINLFGKQYKLLNSINAKLGLTLNGKLMPSSYRDDFNGVRAYFSAGFLVFATSFGLTVKWNGVHKAEVILCDYYANNVCGLCGNADGNKTNDYVDRNNKQVDVNSKDHNNRYHDWASRWRVTDDTPDGYEEEVCKPDKDPGLPEPISCFNDYSSIKYCGLIKDPNGPWRECIRKLPADLIEHYYESCLFDMCALEGETRDQNDYKCRSFDEFTSKCYELASITSQIVWRNTAKCPFVCRKNQVYLKPPSFACPKTCLHPNGDWDCGSQFVEEGCFCTSTTILTQNGECVLPGDCGCRLPNNMGILGVGESFKSPDCTVRWTCPGKGQNVTSEFLQPCNPNAECVGDIDNNPSCVCKAGYHGDGYICNLDEVIETTTTTQAPMFDPDVQPKDQVFCDKSFVQIECSLDKVINILESTHGRANLLECPSLALSSSLCTPSNVTAIVAKECSNKRRCQFTVDSILFPKKCKDVNEYLTVKHKCVPRQPVSDPCADNPCGLGADCINKNGLPLCSCPVGKTGDPNVRCCKTLTCGCWGDPHCLTFDKSKYDFMGVCKYDLVSTNCFNRTLPKGLVPFSIHQKQEDRYNKSNAGYVRNLEIHVYNHKYLLDKKLKGRHRFFIDGVLTPNNFVDQAKGIKVYLSGGKIIFSTSFGLNVIWNGDHKVDVDLCDIYSDHVCGLCGNADGNAPNDFVDRKNNFKDINNNYYNTSYFKWASTWRVPDDSIDSDPKYCNITEDPGPDPEPIRCKNETVYKENKWCGILINPQGPWAQCLNVINPTELNEIHGGCLIDLCASEDDPVRQIEYKCKAYEEMAETCLELLKNSTILNWRSVTGCEKNCGPNEIYTVRKECPKTCLDLTGKKDCGDLRAAEGCFCKDGFVLNANGSCITSQECGCKLPSGSGYMMIGESFKPSCDKKFTCSASNSNVTIENLPPCGMNATCIAGSQGELKCICIDGFIGNGYDCSKLITTTTSTTTPTTTTSTTTTSTTTTSTTTTTTTTTTSTTTLTTTTTSTPTTSTATTSTILTTTTTTSTSTTAPETTKTTTVVFQFSLLDGEFTEVEEVTAITETEKPTTVKTTTADAPTSVKTSQTISPTSAKTTNSTRSTTKRTTNVFDVSFLDGEFTEIEETTPLGFTTTKPSSTIIKYQNSTINITGDTTKYGNNTFNNETCQNEGLCTGFGDPYYTTFDGRHFEINITCPYVLATDYCPGNDKLNYLIIMDHENRYYASNNAYYMKNLAILYNGKTIEVDKQFRVDGVVKNLPYSSYELGVSAQKEGVYIVTRTKYFTVYFDGEQLLKFSTCSKNICGMCGNKNGNSGDDYFGPKQYLVQNSDPKCL